MWNWKVIKRKNTPKIGVFIIRAESNFHLGRKLNNPQIITHQLELFAFSSQTNHSRVNKENKHSRHCLQSPFVHPRSFCNENEKNEGSNDETTRVKSNHRHIHKCKRYIDVCRAINIPPPPTVREISFKWSEISSTSQSLATGVSNGKLWILFFWEEAQEMRD